MVNFFPIRVEMLYYTRRVPRNCMATVDYSDYVFEIGEFVKGALNVFWSFVYASFSHVYKIGSLA